VGGGRVRECDIRRQGGNKTERARKGIARIRETAKRGVDVEKHKHWGGLAGGELKKDQINEGHRLIGVRKKKKQPLDFKAARENGMAGSYRIGDEKVPHPNVFLSRL